MINFTEVCHYRVNQISYKVLHLLVEPNSWFSFLVNSRVDL